MAVLMLLLVAYLLGRRGAGGQPPISSATQQAAVTQAPQTAPPTTPRPTSQGGQATPTAPTGQTIVAFNVPTTYNCSASPRPAGGDLVHLSWTTANATAVSISIDGPGKFADYPANGSADVPFACSVAQHTYLLTTQGSGVVATRTVVIRRA
jgi:hypothetical protein